MMYFTTHLNSYSSKNRACAELNEWINRFNHVLFKDEQSLNAFKAEVLHKIEEFKRKYSKEWWGIRTKISENKIRAYIPGYEEKEIFTITYAKAHSVYENPEQMPADLEKISVISLHTGELYTEFWGVDVDECLVLVHDWIFFEEEKELTMAEKDSDFLLKYKNKTTAVNATLFHYWFKGRVSDSELFDLLFNAKKGGLL